MNRGELIVPGASDELSVAPVRSEVWPRGTSGRKSGL